MGKIGLIIRREYLTRVRKKSFIIMTILGPLLMAGLFIVPIWLTNVNESAKKILVLDESGVLNHGLKGNDNISFIYILKPLDEAKAVIGKSGYFALVHIPKNTDGDLDLLQRNIKLYSDDQVSLSLKVYIRNQIEKQVERLQLESQGVSQELVESIKGKSNVPLEILPIKKIQQTDVELNTILGMVGGILIYFFIFLFGAQVMRGVIEEKTSRIVEVIISSVKPFQLMMGKIVGIALVGLTQFLLWVILTASIYGVFMATIVKEKYSAQNVSTMLQKSQDGTALQDADQLMATQSIINRVDQINWALMIPCFIFYFLGGYLLYGALFAAIGGAVDSESDTQQFMLPISAPLIFSFVMAQTVLNDPTGTVAKWLSIIPFTSPIIMMVRLPFHVEPWELALSMGMLILGFVFTTWVAAKIYRTGILMYGKRITWKEIFRWLRYS
jgi:ABC-2 type transport system permease protein